MTAITSIARWSSLESWAPWAEEAYSAPWPVRRLDEILTELSPTAHKPSADDVVRFAGVRWYGEGVFVRETRDGSQVKGKCFPLRPGALVYNRLFAWKQSFAVVTAEFADVVVSAEFPQFEVDESVARTRFVYLVCSTERFADFALARSTGSTAVSRNRLLQPEFLSMSIPLPPLAEQDRIVAEYEASLASAATALAAARTRADAAWERFSSALVEPPAGDVRAGGMVSVVRFADLSRWDRPGGESGILFKYPVSRLDEVADVRLGVQVPRGNAAKQSKGGVPYLASRNIGRGYLNLEDVRLMAVPETVRDSLALRPDDLLFVEGSGSASEVGRCAIWRGELETCIHQNSVVRARPNSRDVLPEFVEAWFNSDPGNAYIREQATTTSGLYHIGCGKLGGAPVPVPARTTQERLLQGLRSVLSAAEAEAAAARALRMDARQRIEVEVFGNESV